MMDKNPELEAKRVKLEKMRKEKMMRDRNKEKAVEEKVSNNAKEEQRSIEDAIKRAEQFASQASEREKNTMIKQKIESKIINSPLKRQLAITISSFLGEINIQPKVLSFLLTQFQVRFAMYDKMVQAGEDQMPVFPLADDMSEVPPQSTESPSAIRMVSVN